MQPVVIPDTPSSPTEVLPTATMPPDVLIEQVMSYRRGQVRRREFRPLGLVEKVMIEASGVARVGGDNPLTRTRKMPPSLDWMKTGPLLGITPDGMDYLICTPMHHPPDIPDPDWEVPYPPKRWENGLPVPEPPPLLRQNLEDRAAGVFVEKRRASEGRIWSRLRGWCRPEEIFWFVFQPIHQVLLIMHDRSGMAVIECSADAAGRHTALVFSPKYQEGHLLFGRQRVEIYRA